MINIQISRNYTKNDIWGKYLLYHLSNHPDVKTEILKYQMPILVSGRRGYRNLTPFIYNDIIFIIDDWDYASPTCYLLDNPNIPSFYLNNNVCILKIQYCLAEIDNYKKIYEQSKIKILPFTMFSNHSFELENFQWNPEYNHKYDYIITGKPWRHRVPWIRFAETKEAGPNNINTSYIAGDASKPSDNISFYSMLKESKWGLVLSGKGCGAKNRREVEFSSLGMPLALNYIPNYPFDFIPNQDFIYLKHPNDLLSLKNIDPAPFAQRSKHIYNQYFSPQFGVYNSFKMAYETAKQELIYTHKAIDSSSVYDPNTVEILPNTGYNLGLLNNGDQISIQYKYGVWKSWGRKRTRGFVSPDNTNGRGGDMARLGIFNQEKSQKTLIEIVPEHTHNRPFIYTVGGNGLNLCLDICNQNATANGSVSYAVKIIKNSNK